ncbi:zinc-binding dehydrogenase [Streptomyces sp. Go-475]|uniref:zinc-binding dehydrogenase n=1 Tax=Streptomyces sp. Go-475 TaxID=2072505 RepID=UPI0018E56F0A|nr:zinc-binding dehydrogenase [Streptomyces sp. Go-475]
MAASSVNGFGLGTVAGYLHGMMEHRFPLIRARTPPAPSRQSVRVSRAQYVAVPAAIGIAHRPDGVLVRDAGALGLAGTAAFGGVALLGPLEGRTVLISGATGGVGAIAVRLAAARGARVIATAMSGSESGFVSALTDAEVTVIDYTQDVTAQVRAIAPDGVDAVLHLAGDLAELTALTRDGGAVASALTVPEASETASCRPP